MNYLSFLGASILAVLSQLTISGANVALESSDVSSISTSLWQGFSGLLSTLIQLVPAVLLITFGFLVFDWILDFFSHSNNDPYYWNTSKAQRFGWFLNTKYSNFKNRFKNRYRRK